MTKIELARGVAAQLFKAEDAIDLAIREVARLALAVSDARGDLRLAAPIGTDVFDRTAALHGALAASRSQAVALHGALAEVGDRLRVPRTESSGGLDKPPPPPNHFASVEPPADAVAAVRHLRSA